MAQSLLQAKEMLWGEPWPVSHYACNLKNLRVWRRNTQKGPEIVQNSYWHLYTCTRDWSYNTESNWLVSDSNVTSTALKTSPELCSQSHHSAWSMQTLHQKGPKSVHLEGPKANGKPQLQDCSTQTLSLQKDKKVRIHVRRNGQSNQVSIGTMLSMAEFHSMPDSCRDVVLLPSLHHLAATDH